MYGDPALEEIRLRKNFSSTAISHFVPSAIRVEAEAFDLEMHLLVVWEVFAGPLSRLRLLACLSCGSLL